jgi:hypothetical protein
LANTIVPTIQIAVTDAGGNPSPNTVVNFLVTAGGGSIASSTATSDANGVVTAPEWRLGKLAIAQTLRVGWGTDSLIVNANVQTSYGIVVRFWGSTPVSATNQQLFLNAAARLRGIVTGDIDNVQAANFDLAQCDVIGEPPLNEIIDDVVIYASIQPIDGAGGPDGNKLAQAGPCAGRPTATGYQTAIGIMTFDSHDFPTLGSNLQEVVTHEMLHVLGVGVYWDAPGPGNPGGRDYISGSGSGDPRYTAPEARQKCVEIGGTITCATSIPVENVGGAGSEGSHWRESVFGNELMTSVLNTGTNPLSSMTIGSLADLGLVVNYADNDTYGLSALLGPPSALAASPNRKWEQIMQPRFLFEPGGRVVDLRLK